MSEPSRPITFEDSGGSMFSSWSSVGSVWYILKRNQPEAAAPKKTANTTARNTAIKRLPFNNGCDGIREMIPEELGSRFSGVMSIVRHRHPKNSSYFTGAGFLFIILL